MLEANRIANNSSDNLNEAAEAINLPTPEDGLPWKDEIFIIDPFTPSLLEEVGETRSDSWHYVTPKFQEARAAMYASHKSGFADSPGASIREELLLQIHELTVGETPPNNVTNALVANLYFLKRPMCGASIGAFNGEAHLLPVSLGGIVLVGGEPYGMTVHHMLDTPIDDESDDEAETNNPEPAPIYDVLVEETERSQKTDSQSLNSLMSSFESFDADDFKIRITQPGIDDVHDFFTPSYVDRDQDHLDCYDFGSIYASSGIRRWKRNDVLHEIHRALIKVNPDRLQRYNVIQGDRRFCPETKPPKPPPLEEPVSRHGYLEEEDEYPMEVAPANFLGGLRVHCFARTTGLQEGVIGNSVTKLKLHRRKIYSDSWHVSGGFGLGGDTGAWVIENNTSRVCGIVLTRRPERTYIMPMQVILEDIKWTLGAKDVRLPSLKVD